MLAVAAAASLPWLQWPASSARDVQVVYPGGNQRTRTGLGNWGWVSPAADVFPWKCVCCLCSVSAVRCLPVCCFGTDAGKKAQEGSHSGQPFPIPGILAVLTSLACDWWVNLHFACLCPPAPPRLPCPPHRTAPLPRSTTTSSHSAHCALPPPPQNMHARTTRTHASTHATIPTEPARALWLMAWPITRHERTKT